MVFAPKRRYGLKTYLRLLAATVVAGSLCAAGVATAQKTTPKPTSTKPGAAKLDIKPAPEVVATVNGEKITKTQIAGQLLDDQIARLAVTHAQFKDNQRPVAGAAGTLLLKKMQAAGGKPVSVSRQEILDFLIVDRSPIVLQTLEQAIRERVVAQAAKKAGITATDAEIQVRYAEALNQIRTSYNLTGMSDKQVIHTLGFRTEPARRQLRFVVQLEKLVQKDVEGKLGHKIDTGDFVVASHILIRVNEPDQTKEAQAFAEAKAKIEGYRADIVGGKITFGEAAAKYSDDQSKVQQGNLGVFMRGQMVKEFEDAAFGMEAGKVSDPVKTQYGYHLIKIDRLGKDTTAPERKVALDNRLRQMMQPHLVHLMQRAQVDNKLAPQAAALPMPGPGGAAPGR